MLNAITLGVVMLNVVMLSAVMLSVIMLSVIMLNVVAPQRGCSILNRGLSVLERFTQSRFTVICEFAGCNGTACLHVIQK